MNRTADDEMTSDRLGSVEPMVARERAYKAATKWRENSEDRTRRGP
jgi:hypothetical protein